MKNPILEITNATSEDYRYFKKFMEEGKLIKITQQNYAIKSMCLESESLTIEFGKCAVFKENLKISRVLAKIQNSREVQNFLWDAKQKKEHDEIEKRTGIRPLKWRPTETKSKG